MKAIGVFGRKGGSGKTMVSHFLSHGLSELKHATVMLQTDVRTTRPPELINTRAYMLASTRGDNSSDTDLILQLVEKVGQIPDSVLVADGGANRRNIDFALAHICNLILIPTGYSPEDVSVAEHDYWELTEYVSQNGLPAEVYIVMNRWPGVTQKLSRIQQRPWVREFLARCERNGNLFPYYLPDMPSLLDMAHGEDPKYTPMIDSKARAFAKLVALKIGLDGGADDGKDWKDTEGDDDDGSSAPPAVLAAAE